MKIAPSVLIRAGLLSLALGATTASAECNPDYSGVTLDVGTRTRPFIASAIEITFDDTLPCPLKAQANIIVV